MVQHYATVLFVELDQGHADLLMKALQDQYHPANDVIKKKEETSLGSSKTHTSCEQT